MVKSVTDRPLLSDFRRACEAAVSGILVGLALGFILKPPHVFLEFGALVAGPSLFVVLLLNYRRRMRRLAAARTLGFMVGWLTFVALYLDEGFSRPIFALRNPGLVLIVFSLVALILIATGLAISDYLWLRVHSNREL